MTRQIRVGDHTLPLASFGNPTPADVLVVMTSPDTGVCPIEKLRVCTERGKVAARKALHPALAASTYGANQDSSRYQLFTKLVTLIEPMPVAKSHPVVVG
jgi:hypothetical protein